MAIRSGSRQYAASSELRRIGDEAERKSSFVRCRLQKRKCSEVEPEPDPLRARLNSLPRPGHHLTLHEHYHIFTNITMQIKLHWKDARPIGGKIAPSGSYIAECSTPLPGAVEPILVYVQQVPVSSTHGLQLRFGCDRIVWTSSSTSFAYIAKVCVYTQSVACAGRKPSRRKVAVMVKYTRWRL